MMVAGLNVTSFVPGRLRLKVDDVRRSPDFVRRLREILGAVPGVEHIEVNSSTGSVLVNYDTVVTIRGDGRLALIRAVSELFPFANVAVLQALLDRAT